LKIILTEVAMASGLVLEELEVPPEVEEVLFCPPRIAGWSVRHDDVSAATVKAEIRSSAFAFIIEP
jgi:citrate synthase